MNDNKKEMQKITLRGIIQDLEEKLTLVPQNKLARYAIYKLRQLEKRINRIIQEKMKEEEKFGSVEFGEFFVVAFWLSEILGEEENE